LHPLLGVGENPNVPRFLRIAAGASDADRSIAPVRVRELSQLASSFARSGGDGGWLRHVFRIAEHCSKFGLYRTFRS